MAQLRAVVDVPGGETSARIARHVVRTVLDGWGCGPVIETAELVVSELVTNAVLHAAGTPSYELELVSHDGGVRVSIADGSSVAPVIRELEDEHHGGRGLRIVAALARAWGHDSHHGGKRVWVELAADGSS